jgi:hypothetical protein
MLHYLLFEICPSFMIFPLGALIIYLGSKMFACGIESLENGQRQYAAVMCYENNEKLKMNEYNHHKNW